MSPEGTRLNKWIADSGLCSRREADRLIQAGQVTVDGQVVQTLGFQVQSPNAQIAVSGEALPTLPKVYLLFNKPSGVLSTRSDERGRQTLYDLLPPRLRHVDSAGRLDRDSSGALILSSDGDFLHRVTHPSFHLPKCYRVTLARPLNETILRKLTEGVRLLPEDKLAQVTSVEWEAPCVVKLSLITGYNRQIRRSFEILGCTVRTLKRVSIGPIHLGDLRPGKSRPLLPAELKALVPDFSPPARAVDPERRLRFKPRFTGKFNSRLKPSNRTPRDDRPEKPSRPGKTKERPKKSRS